MFKVLIALDGSPISDQALTMACDLLTGKEVAVTLLHVIPRHLIYGKGGPVVAECYDPDAERAASEALLDSSEQRVREAGIGPHIDKLIAVGDPADLILLAAVEADTDLIVMGSRGLSVAQRFLLGSVSTKVSSHAHCAVLVAHPKVAGAHIEVEAEPTKEAVPV